MIFRDDDISASTDLAVLKPIHNQFKEALVMHTVAIICKDLNQHTELVNYLKADNFNPQIHCWEHINMVENKGRLADDIKLCLEMFELCGFDRPTTVYPPWNIADSTVHRIVEGYGMKVSTQKCSLSYYVSHQGNVGTDTINFHYWDDECKDLAEALRIYNTKR